MPHASNQYFKSKLFTSHTIIVSASADRPPCRFPGALSFYSSSSFSTLPLPCRPKAACSPPPPPRSPPTRILFLRGSSHCAFRFEPAPPANLNTGSSAFDRAEDFMTQSRQRLTDQAQVTAVTLLESYAAEQGNICDLGNLATVCIIERSKLWTSPSVFISSRGAGHDSVASVPFASQVQQPRTAAQPTTRHACCRARAPATPPPACVA
jgi:hypothetical protein